ncbi:MAG: hypothetical protein LBR73_09655 [Oscillospiraceae bacterium]|jgi:bacteriorhodopsin|nr:hypothetical protein [Oscillospiraceae bacterium]
MVICFGLSWPLSIWKSLKARTAKGKSLFFLCAIDFGYAAGIAAKLVTGRITYVFIFYCINLVLVTADIVLYFRNAALDRKGEE